MYAASQQLESDIVDTSKTVPYTTFSSDDDMIYEASQQMENENWRQERNKRILKGNTSGHRLSLISHELKDLNDDELNYCLCRFLLEVRKKNGTEYPPKTLRQIVLLIQMHMINLGRSVHFLSDPLYSEVKNTLDNVMKMAASKGLGMLVRQASIISVEQEEIMWNEGILGSSCPQTLLDTMLYVIGLNFALRSGDEHRILTIHQFELGVNEQGQFLRYHENISKCNQRGLKDYSVASKSVTAYASDEPDKCIVALYRKYRSLRPRDAPPAFYLRPLTKLKKDQWYSVVPVGQYTLGKTVSRMCAAAGFTGFYTNHSLRATCATRLFRSGVDKQLIAKTTGHRSNAIRNYKRISEEQEDEISRIVQGKTRKCHCSATSVFNQEVEEIQSGSVDISFKISVKK